MTTTEIETLAHHLAQCAKPGIYHKWHDEDGWTPVGPSMSVEARHLVERLKRLIGPERAAVLDRSADIVAAEMDGRIER